MPFSGTTFTNVAGATSAASGQTVQSATWNAIFTDYAAALTQLNSQYASINSNRNILWMNGGFEVWQRGSGSTSSIALAASAAGPYTADRWYVWNGPNQAMVAQAVSGLVSQSLLAGKFQRNAAQTGTGVIRIGYPLDTDEIVRMRGKNVAISLLIKTGANFSGTSFSVNLYTGTGSPGKRITGPYTNEANPISVTTTAAVNTSYSVSAQSSSVLSTAITQAELQISFTPVGTAGADDSISLDDISVEVITSTQTWTPMNYDRAQFPEMLQGCKRFYQKTFPYSIAPANAVATTGGSTTFTPETPGVGAASFAAHPAFIQWSLPVELRLPYPALPNNYTIYNPVNNVNNTLYATTGENPGAVSVNALDAQNISFTVSALSATTGDYQVYCHIVVSADL